MVVSSKRQKELKPLGALLQKDKEHFSVRILSRVGNFTTEELINIAQLAKKYGRGYLGETTRLQIEIPWIKDEDLEDFIEEAESLGLRHGGTGPKVRSLVVCKGSICIHGNINTQKIGKEIEDKYFGMKTPHKCKIGIGGCINNCAKANMSDIGIVGITVPKFIIDNCVGCGLCVSSCKLEALKVVDKKVVHDKDSCLNCGECVRMCKLNAAITKESGAQIYVGGTLGRNINIGHPLDRIFKEDEIITVIDSIMEYYMEVGKEGERIYHVINRIGENKFMNEILKRVDAKLN